MKESISAATGALLVAIDGVTIVVAAAGTRWVTVAIAADPTTMLECDNTALLSFTTSTEDGTSDSKVEELVALLESTVVVES